MSTPRNPSGIYMPHPEGRTSSGTLNALNAEVVHDVNGDASAVIHVVGSGLTATYNVQCSFDGLNYYDLLAYPYTPGCVGGTALVAGLALVTEAISGATVIRTLCVATGGVKKIRIRLSAWSAGTGAVTINSDERPSISPFVRDMTVAALGASQQGTVGAALTVALPLVVSLRHYIRSISVVRSATAALATSAAPVLVTTTNLPGTFGLIFGADAGGVGVDKTATIDGGSGGIAALAVGTATTIVCPAYAGVVWRVNVLYRLGL